MIQRILVTGASVAGNAAAWWLSRSGFDVTVVERTSSFRDGGQNVDVRGVGREVLRRMRLEGAALARNTGEKGTVLIDRKGRAAARFMVDNTGRDGPTAEMEILRGDLARLLFEATGDRVRYRFGDSVARVAQDPDGVTVGFAGGTEQRFDLLVVAEGVGSATRELVFPGENRPRWLDLLIAYFTIPRTAEDEPFWRWYHATGGRGISLRPDNHGTTRAMLTLRKRPEGEQSLPVAAQKALLRERFADAGWQAARVLDGMERTEDFYVDALRQVRMPRWSSDRVVLIGDAAWCVTPLGGYGTTLAVTAGCVVAGELRRDPDHRAALLAFEAALRPVVEQVQGVPRLVPRLMNPDSRIAIRLMHAVMSLAGKPAVRGLADTLFANRTPEPDLSRYEILPDDLALAGRS